MWIKLIFLCIWTLGAKKVYHSSLHAKKEIRTDFDFNFLKAYFIYFLVSVWNNDVKIVLIRVLHTEKGYVESLYYT